MANTKAQQLAQARKREALVGMIRRELISTQDAADELGVTKTRLNKISALEVVVRGFYLRADVEAYKNDEKVQERREKHTAGKRVEVKEAVKRTIKRKVKVSD